MKFFLEIVFGQMFKKTYKYLNKKYVKIQNYQIKT